jgi:hypothetical protein
VRPGTPRTPLFCIFVALTQQKSTGSAGDFCSLQNQEKVGFYFFLLSPVAH